ncbi:hypothetical protein M378DRAFT_943488 [Amanita muscaria Koide BX008]|uniref:DUF6533 domain-containing protein n=1 Tax=Amanita muscaria (strain Koide BX008) TaxID=946122 RepID=A0A0C2TM79_AMAMK|nr:hypothetical protein M378DRAFT_943488 [Amanita muscaria Koide BX008]
MGNALCALAFQAAAVTLGIYDWLITFDQEVNLLWVRRWTAAKILFLLNRHIGPLYLLAQFSEQNSRALSISVVGQIVSLDLIVVAHLLTNHTQPADVNFFAGQKDHLLRKTLVAGQTWLEVKIFFMGIFVWIWLLQFTLLYRTFAIYSNVKSVKHVLIGGYILGICTHFLMFPILFLKLTAKGSQDSSEGTFCDFSSPHPAVVVFWLPSFVYGLIFITLCVRIAIKHAHYSNLIYGTRTATWARFVQDCILYFAITSAVLLGNAVAWVILPSEWYLVPMDFSIMIICAAGNRLVFRLIQVYHGPPDDEQKSLDQIHMGDTLPLQFVAGGSEGVYDRNSGSSIIVEQTRDSGAVHPSSEQHSNEIFFQG